MRGRFTAALALALLAFTATQIPGTARAAEVDASKSAVVGARTEINIARIKSALRLTSEQLEAWAAIENTLLTIAREQAQQISDAAQPSRRMVAIVFNNTNAQRLAAVAMPLIKTLKPEQKKVAQDLAQQIGLGAYAAFI